MDIGGWLRSLGLEGYEAAFRENEIDEAVLLNLTVEDLKELGVGLVGHRRKLLDAIAALRANSNSEAPRPARASPTPTNMASADAPRLNHLASGAISRSCSAISSARQALPQSSTPRSGATLLAAISVPRRQQ